MPRDTDGANLEQYYAMIDKIISPDDILIFKNLSFFGIDGYADFNNGSDERSSIAEEGKNDAY